MHPAIRKAANALTSPIAGLLTHSLLNPSLLAPCSRTVARPLSLSLFLCLFVFLSLSLPHFVNPYPCQLVPVPRNTNFGAGMPMAVQIWSRTERAASALIMSLQRRGTHVESDSAYRGAFVKPRYCIFRDRYKAKTRDVQTKRL